MFQLIKNIIKYLGVRSLLAPRSRSPTPPSRSSSITTKNLLIYDDFLMTF
jgi:hypothetical protein